MMFICRIIMTLIIALERIICTAIINHPSKPNDRFPRDKYRI